MTDIYSSQNNTENNDSPEGKINPQLDVNITLKHKKEQHHHAWDRHPLSSFRHYPDRANFINKDTDEEVVLIVRKHPFTNVKWIVATIIMLFAPVVLAFFPILSFLPEAYRFIAVVGWYLITTAFAFENFLSWFFNVNIITNQRVVDVNFVNLIYREIPEADLEQIQDVTVAVGSVLRTFFNYGDVIIQTASEVQRISFDAIPNPDGVAKILRDYRELEEEKNR